MCNPLQCDGWVLYILPLGQFCKHLLDDSFGEAFDGIQIIFYRLLDLSFQKKEEIRTHPTGEMQFELSSFGPALLT